MAELRQHGHGVTALIRDEAQAETVAVDEATASVIDLYDRSGATC